MKEDIKLKFINSVKWTGLYSAFHTVSAPIYKIVLARMLLPEEFAYIAIISLVIGLSNLINNLGLSEAIIQKEEINSNELSAVFTFNFFKAIVVMLLVLSFAPLIERFYDYSKVAGLVRLVSITIFFNGTSSVFRAYLQKKLHFKPFALMNTYRTISDMAITVLFVSLGYGAYGYVFGTVFSTVTYSIQVMLVSLRIAKMKIGFCFSYKVLSPFINFGVFVSMKQILTYISHHIDEIVIGKLLGPEILGVYYFAKDLIKKSQDIITNVFSQVLFPTFSIVQNDRNRLISVYLKITRYVATLAFPVYIGISLTAHLFVPVFFGDKWLGAINIIRIYSFAGIFLLLTANIASSVLYAINRPKLVFQINFITIVFYFVALYIFNVNSLLVILAIYISYIIIKTSVLQFMATKSLGSSYKNYVQTLKKPLCGTLLMVAMVVGVDFLLFKDSLLIRLVFAVVTGIATYSAYIYLFDKNLVSELRTMIFKRRLKL